MSEVEKIRSAPELIAASKCWLSRTDGAPDGPLFPMTSSTHPKGECRWCGMSAGYLRVLLDDAHRWNLYNDGRPLEDFGRLARPEQEKRVLRAQYGDLAVDAPNP